MQTSPKILGIYFLFKFNEIILHKYAELEVFVYFSIFKIHLDGRIKHPSALFPKNRVVTLRWVGRVLFFGSSRITSLRCIWIFSHSRLVHLENVKYITYTRTLSS